jgi:DNA replication regulator DPB11
MLTCSGSKLYRDEPDERERSKYRTECWLERCMFEERICSPAEHVSFTPLTIETPVPGKCFRDSLCSEFIG